MHIFRCLLSQVSEYKKLFNLLTGFKLHDNTCSYLQMTVPVIPVLTAVSVRMVSTLSLATVHRSTTVVTPAMRVSNNKLTQSNAKSLRRISIFAK